MRIFVIAAALLLGSATAYAETAPSTPPIPEPARQVLLSRLQAGATLARYLESIRQEFQNLDADSNGDLTHSDADLHKTMTTALARNTFVQAIMRFDLDGDGVVTVDEIKSILAYTQRTQRHNQSASRELSSALVADKDKDGRITHAEAQEFARSEENTRRAGADMLGDRVRLMLTIPAAGSGKLTLPNLEDAATGFFNVVDSDRNGTISQDELQNYRSANPAVPSAMRSATGPECILPKASEQAKVVLLSAYETDALSTVTIGSQDVAVRTGRIVVEPGSEPLYLVVVSHRPVIWRFTGAVERVERLMLASSSTGPNRSVAGETPLAGETGIAREKVYFLPKPNCLRYFDRAPTQASAITSAKVRNETGKEPVVAAIYQVSEFRVPSGEVVSERANNRPTIVVEQPAGTLAIDGTPNSPRSPRIVFSTGDLAAATSRFYPGGIVRIDASAVVASAPPADYEVLPNQAGLMQLVESGALEQSTSREFLIKKKIRFPAELHGAHSANFLLLRGVPEPEGNPGHSCVIREDTGLPLRGASTCR